MSNKYLFHVISISLVSQPHITILSLLLCVAYKCHVTTVMSAVLIISNLSGNSCSYIAESVQC